jgi:L-seryl-tRNA(Ser) seleniumtransferase
MTVAALESVLRLYATDRRDELPLWDFLSVDQGKLLSRAKALATCFKGSTARAGEAVAGGGSLPGYAIPSAELVIRVPTPEDAAAKLRVGRPSVFCRVDDGSLVFDLRAVRPQDDDRLARAIRYVLEQS